MLAELMSDPRNDLIEKYHPFVERVVIALMRRHGLRKEDLKEYISAGYMGLIEAAERYDPHVGVTFEGFAHRRVRGAVLDMIRRSSEVKGASYRILKAIRTINAMEESLTEVLSSNVEDSQEMLKKVFDFTANGFLAIRLQGISPEEIIDSDTDEATSPEFQLIALEKHNRLKRVVEKLPEKERFIVEQHYFYGRDFYEIIELRPELSKSWVSKLHSRALELLADYLRKEGGI